MEAKTKSETTSRISRLFHILLDAIEIYIPATMLICLFVSFVAGIIFRYVFKDPQSWTFELSSISFLQLAILSGCFVQRKDEHIVFDMFYQKRTPKAQCAMRLIGGIIVCITATLLIIPSIQYVDSMMGLKTQVLKWPRWTVFVCFPITFVIMDIRCLLRVIFDLRAYKNRTYSINYLE